MKDKILNLTEAAPDMYEALKALMVEYESLANSGDCGCWNVYEDEEYIMAVNAINKAEGK